MSNKETIFSKCIEAGCARPFTIEPGEQEYFEQREMHLPKRCRDCRAKRKAAAAEGEQR